MSESNLRKTQSPYTPTTEEVRTAYAYSETRLSYYPPSLENANVEFDRWLAEVKAQAWTEGFIAQLWSEGSRNPYRKGEN